MLLLNELARRACVGSMLTPLWLLCCHQVTAFAKKYALENGPIILELDTYR
jgi:hypothetical protein